MAQGTVSTALVRFVLHSLRGLGVDSAVLSRRVGLPVWALGDDTVQVPTLQLVKVWRLGRLEFPDPHLGLRISGRWSRGWLHLNDYLFETAATLGEGFTTAIRYIHVVGDDGDADDVDVIGDDGHLTIRYQVRGPSAAWAVGWLVGSFLVLDVSGDDRQGCAAAGDGEVGRGPQVTAPPGASTGGRGIPA
ncbi:hypothetical protein GCM10023196_028900 [Actinoallomurus vinaceus]|uniref:HTH-type transcriptional regulator AraC-type N-terminal domain-containing protein n=1 Tax=Actinoallomurus vinaceus TaxID=1080074 RepID=A0ABP8U6U8_9ACTN